jgi:hypothetical protein
MLRKAAVSLAIALPMLGAALAPSVVRAEDSKGPNSAADAKKPEGLSSVKLLELSSNLAKLGRANKDPLQLIVAAQLLQGAGAKYEARPPKEDPKADMGPEKADSVASLLDEAKALSKNDKTIVAIADDVKASASKGRVGGGIISLGTISGNTVHTREFTFQGNRSAEIALVGLDTSSVKLEIYDQNGNLICRDTDPAYCPFTPAWTGPFIVKVYNLGDGGAHYKLETN